MPLSGQFPKFPGTITCKSIMSTVYNKKAYNFIIPEDLGAFHGICYASGKNSVHGAKAKRTTINLILLGQRFPKHGTQNNCRRNKDALFILIDRYLFFYEH